MIHLYLIFKCDGAIAFYDLHQNMKEFYDNNKKKWYIYLPTEGKK